MEEHIIQVKDLSHHYGDRVALKDINFGVKQGEIFGFLGPNGGGKTTLFRILSTAMSASNGGSVEVDGANVMLDPNRVREKLGVVFQSPSLDKKLSVFENLKHQGHLYGLSGKELTKRIHHNLERLHLLERKSDRVETLSGGLKRRAEIAKALLHNPKILLLDEPTTGLDPGVRMDVWEILKTLRDEQKITCLVTTHLIEEAERCHRVCILNEGKIVALDTPKQLKSEIGGEIITIQSKDNEGLKKKIEDHFKVETKILDGHIRIQHDEAEGLLIKIKDKYSDKIDMIAIAKPSLEDVFILKTGHEFWGRKQ